MSLPWEVSLFTGAGGGLLATRGIFRPVAYVEWDEWCQDLLRRRIEDGQIEDAPIFGDIDEFIRGGFAGSLRPMADGVVVTGGFPVSPSLLLESVEEPRMLATSGRRRRRFLASFDRVSRCWRTFRAFLGKELEDTSGSFLGTWPKWGIAVRGVVMELTQSEHLTVVGGSGSERSDSTMYPTPAATVYGSSVNGILRHGGESEQGCEKPRPGAGRPSLETMARHGSWPTPTVNDSKNNGGPSQQFRNTQNLNVEVGGRLNPDWVEWLMGWPLGWTDPVGSPLDHYGWEIDPADVDLVPRVVPEHYKGRRERLKALGNGMVPQCARLGWGLR